MAKETPEERAERETKTAEAANLAAAEADDQDSSSEAVSAANVAASEAAGKITTARAETLPPEGPQNPDKTRPGDRTSEDQTTAVKGKKSKNYDTVERFIELSGYKKSDVVGHNDERRTVVTANGGKYELSPKGTKLRKLSGPDTPADRESEEDDDE